jgi:hypothetical protein
VGAVTESSLSISSGDAPPGIDGRGGSIYVDLRIQDE